MRYLQLMYTYAPAWGFGGPSRVMYDYARWMVRDGVDMEVIAGDINHDYSGLPRRREEFDGIPITRVRVFLRHLVKRALNVVSPSMLLLALRRVRSGAGLTVVHIAEFRSPVFLYAALLRRLVPGRVLLVHSAFGMLHQKRSALRDSFDPLFMRFMLRSVDVGLVQNEHEAGAYHDLARKYGARNVRVRILPLHTPGPDPGSPERTMDYRQLLRDRYGVPRQAIVGVFLGRLHYEKGILRTIDAFLAFALRARKPAQLLVIGRDDGFQQDIADHIASLGAEAQVRIVNNVYQERFEYYTLADFFLGFPTIHEETMLSSVEALSCGTPVVVSLEADIPYVESGGAGFVIDFSVARAASCMERIAADVEGFRQQAIAVANTHFTESAACGALRSILEDAARECAAEER